MSKKRDLYNMAEYDENNYEEEDGDGEYVDPMYYNDMEVNNEIEEPPMYVNEDEYDEEGDELYYPEQARGGYIDENFDYETEEPQGQYYDMYDPNFQRFLLKNGIIKYDSDSEESSPYSSESNSESDEDEKPKKKGGRKKKTLTKKKTTRKRK